MPNPIPKPTGRQIGGASVLAIIAAALAGVYINEGGYADHAHDRGGKTRYGITENVARAYGYRGAMRDLPKHCHTPAMVCADRIYTERYIDGPGFRPLASVEPAILYELVDSAVLHGPPRPSGWFQEALNGECDAGLVVDRKVGPRTVAAYRSCQRQLGPITACLTILDALDRRQERFFRAIVANDEKQRVFLKGWLRMRIGNVDRGKCGGRV